ncbi:hypothetical protein FI667_g15558, partial [Globisporangium splendens]
MRSAEHSLRIKQNPASCRMGRRSCRTSPFVLFFLFCGLQQLVCLAQPAVDTSTTHDSNSTIQSPQQKPPLIARVENDPDAVSFETLDASLASSPSRLTFKILQLADLHYTGNPNYPCLDAPRSVNGEPCTEALMTTFIDDLLDVEKPDLVVFSGDNAGASTVADRQVAVDAFTMRVEARKIPYAVILGNHDDDNGFPREEALRLVMEKNYSYTERGPMTIDGVGNYRLSVQAPVDGPWGNAADNVFHMYFLDSGSHPNKTRHPDVVSNLYDWIHPSQVDYYMNLSREAQEEAGTLRPLPAVMFFHIPLQEHAQGALEYWRRTGEMSEKVAASSVPSTLFSTLVRRGEVKATFSGHDHTNAYCYRRRGIQLCCAGGTGFGAAYGSEDFSRRARVIEWSVNSDNERTITSWKRLYGRLDERYQEEVLFTESKTVKVGLMASGATSAGFSLWYQWTSRLCILLALHFSRQ